MFNRKQPKFLEEFQWGHKQVSWLPINCLHSEIMAINKKKKYKAVRRNFGKPGGKRSQHYRTTQKAALYKKEHRILLYTKDNKTFRRNITLHINLSLYPTLVTQTKITVRRLQLYRDSSSKMVKLGSTSLKFKFVKNTKPITGYRIMNLDLLQKHLCSINIHTCMCKKAQQLVSDGKEPVTLKSEIDKKWLIQHLSVCMCRVPRKVLQNSDKQITACMI